MNISDIAKKAGVSKSAVSIALNNKPGLSDVTREKILKVVRESGYRHRSMVEPEKLFGPSKIFRLLACMKNDMVSDQYNTTSFFSELIHGMEKYGRESGYALVFSSVEAKGLKKQIEELEKEHASQGIILLGTNLSPDELSAVCSVQPNLVVLDTFFELLDMNFVVMDNTGGAFKAAQYLLELGHRDIGYVYSASRLSNFVSREQGFADALSQNDIVIKEENKFPVVSDIDSSRNRFKEIVSERKGSLPGALFCECDYIAIGVIKALTELGIRVPHDISVIGFDNVAESSVVSPELTTINVNRDKMAEMAVKRLIDIVEEKDGSRMKIIINTDLVVRNSC